MPKAKTDKTAKKPTTKRGAKRVYLPEITETLTQIDFELLNQDASRELDAGKRQHLESRQKEHRQQLQEVEHRLVYGDDLAKYGEKLALIGEELARLNEHPEYAEKELPMIEKEKLTRNECYIGALPSESMAEEFLKPIQRALIDKDAGFFRAIANLIDFHDREEPASSIDIAFLVLRQRDGITSGTRADLRIKLEELKKDGILDHVPSDNKTIVDAAKRHKFSLTKATPGPKK